MNRMWWISFIFTLWLPASADAITIPYVDHFSLLSDRQNETWKEVEAFLESSFFESHMAMDCFGWTRDGRKKEKGLGGLFQMPLPGDMDFPRHMPWVEAYHIIGRQNGTMSGEGNPVSEPSSMLLLGGGLLGIAGLGRRKIVRSVKKDVVG